MKENKIETGNRKPQETKRAQAAREGRERKEEYKQRKLKIFEFEKKNLSHLLVFRTDKNWWTLGGNSALIYYYRLVPRLNIKVNLRADSDFFANFKYGVVSLKDVDKFCERIESLGLKLKTKKESAILYTLPNPLTTSDIKRLQEMEKTERENLNKDIAPKITEPELYMKLRELEKMIYNNMKKDDAVNREYLTMEMAKYARQMLEIFLMTANGVYSEKEGFLKLRLISQKLRVQVAIVAEEKIWAQKNCLKMAAKIVEIQKIFEKHGK